MPVRILQTQNLLWKSLSIGISGAVLFYLVSIIHPLDAQSQNIDEVQKYITNGGYAITRNGQTVFSHNFKKLFIPASTLKLVTSLAALEILGPEYRFTTQLYLDVNNNLYIKGYGDPFLVSEKIAIIARTVAQKRITAIHNIILDDSAFALEAETDGSEDSQNPYDAQCAAIGVNFNSLPVMVYHNGKVQSPEPQTPYLALMGRAGRELKSGYHRINVNSFPPNSALSNSLLYSGQLFQALLQKYGVSVSGTIQHGQVPQDAHLILNYIAEETVTKLVRTLLLSSNNFMANQLFLAVGVSQYGLPATWIKSRRAMKVFLRNFFNLTDRQMIMVEGSGLSPKNRISPEAMIVVLQKFKPYSSLLPVKHGIRMKSGTLKETGVFCYAGYFAQDKNNNPFVILLNQDDNNRDKILRIFRH